VYLNRNSDFVESTNLYKKVGYANCGDTIKNYQEDRPNQDYKFNNDTRGAYEYINEQIHLSNQKNINGSFIQDKMVKTLPSNSDENWPASYNQMVASPITKSDDTTLFCGNSQVFSKEKFVIQKDGWNRITVMIPAYDLIDSEQAKELLYSLGMTLSNSNQVYKDSFVELTCNIDSVNFVSAK
jgi:hypothetical protein